MATVTLRSDLAHTLEQEARRRGITLEKVVDEWLHEQWQETRKRRLAEQTQLFWAQHAELYAQYPDKYVAFHDGIVLDDDVNVRDLALRVQAEYGDTPMVIARVTASPNREFKVISTHLEEPST